MKYYAMGMSLLTLFFVAGASPVDAQVQRDRFVVVKAGELAENPQRYWSRGIVFEDVLVDVTGRSRRAGGKRYIQIETRTAGRSYVDEDILPMVQTLREGRNYLYAGTVLSESRRSFPMFRSRTHYMIAINAVERVADDAEDDLLDAFIGDEEMRPAFQNVQKAVVQAQNRLVAFAQNEGVEIATLFDPAAATMDKAAEVSRVAVRALEQELGVTSIEMLSQLVRELLMLQYVERDHGEPAPYLEEPEELEESEAEPTWDAEFDEEEATTSRPARFWRGRQAEEAEEDAIVSEPETLRAPELVIEEPPREEAIAGDVFEPEEPSERRGFFRRRARDVSEEEVIEPEAPVVTEPEIIVEEEPPPERTRPRRSEPITPVVPPPDREGPYAPVRR